MKRTLEQESLHVSTIFKNICSNLNLRATKDDAHRLVQLVNSNLQQDTTTTAAEAALPPTVTVTTEQPLPTAGDDDDAAIIIGSNHQSRCVIYVLELVEGKFYVGRSATHEGVQKRIAQHKQGHGALWTNKYPFVRLVSVVEQACPFYEDAITLREMHLHGVDNVRGGTYSQVKLPRYQLDVIEDQILGATDHCYQCKQPGHFAQACTLKKQQQTTTKKRRQTAAAVLV